MSKAEPKEKTKLDSTPKTASGESVRTADDRSATDTAPGSPADTRSSSSASMPEAIRPAEARAEPLGNATPKNRPNPSQGSGPPPDAAPREADSAPAAPENAPGRVEPRAEATPSGAKPAADQAAPKTETRPAAKAPGSERAEPKEARAKSETPKPSDKPAAEKPAAKDKPAKPEPKPASAKSGTKAAAPKTAAKAAPGNTAPAKSITKTPSASRDTKMVAAKATPSAKPAAKSASKPATSRAKAKPDITPPKPATKQDTTKPATETAAAPAKPGPPRAEDIPVNPAAPSARLRRRHGVIVTTFVLLVVAPLALAFWYLTERAVDQYHSQLSFSVRKEQTQPAVDLVGGLAQLSGSSSGDADILYQFIQSQELIAALDTELNLRDYYATHYDQDPVFSLPPDAAMEDLVEYWPRIVRVHFDRGTGIIEVRVLAFDAVKAQEIGQAILDKGAAKINELSAIAREDTMRYAREELDLAVSRLTEARQAMTEFRLRTQIVDPFADLQGQMGLLNTLQQEHATTLIELGLLRDTAPEGDPRIAQAERRLRVIKSQIAAERAKFGVGGEGPGGEDYATLVAEFERLKVDQEFAEQAYKSALSAHDTALAEAQRQSRYLAAHIEPTLAETSRYPHTPTLLGIAAAFLLLTWAVGILIYYSIRDRR